MDYIVYKTTNLVNNKFYIGVHKNKSEEFDGYLGSNRVLISAIKKYGKEKFKRETLFECSTAEEAFEIESLLVCETILTRKDIYNIEPGGKGNTNLGKTVVDRKIGIHALTFEERSEISKETQRNRDPEERLKMCSDGGKIGSRVGIERKSGLYGLSDEERSKNSRLGLEKQKELGLGFHDPKLQSDLGKRGGIKNLGFKWYNDGVNTLKYTKQQQINLTFEDFLLSNPQYTKGRFKVPYKSRIKQQGKICITNGNTNKMFDSKKEALEFIENNSEYRFGRTNFKKK